jgi:WXG100 family type VII secretion target
MALTEVTTAQMGSIAGQLDTLIADFHTAYTQIQTLGTELDSMWTGDAHTKFKGIMDTDAPKFTQFETMLKEYSTAVHNDAATYATAEQNAINAIQAQH